MIRKLVVGALASACLATIASAQTATAPAGGSEVSPATTATITLNTSPLYSDYNQDYHACNVVNVTAKTTILISVQLITASGSIVNSYTNYSLGPGKSIELAGNGTSDAYFARCQFVFKGAATYVRANETVFKYLTSYYASVAFSEAR